MKNVVVASLNPVKLEAARLSFGQSFPGEEFVFIGVAALSGIPSQPLSKDQTLQGAQNRLVSAQSLHPGADFYIAFEGGIEDNEGIMEEFAWVATTDGRKSGKACSALFLAPPRLRALVIEQGLEVGDATDILFNEENSKQKIGAVGQLTKGLFLGLLSMSSLAFSPFYSSSIRSFIDPDFFYLFLGKKYCFDIKL